MIKGSNEKSFKKDIHIFKIQGNSKCCTQRGDSNCEDCYIFGPICINKTFQKYRFLVITFSSCVRERQFTLQEDHNVSIYVLFYFQPVGPNMEISSKAPQKGKTSSLSFLPKFN